MSALIPVTIITGFLGSGKTTLLRHILQAGHGQRIAVIENEYAAESIDNDLLVQERNEQIVEMNNGCICCHVRGDLVRILGELQARRAAGTLLFDRVIIETTGLAAPSPVAQTFFVDPDVGRHYLLDAILTVVDAVHGLHQLEAHHEAQEQVGFADRVLLSKTDLVTDADLAALRARLVALNPRAALVPLPFGVVPLETIIDIRGFNLTAALEIDAAFLAPAPHTHGTAITSFVYRSRLPMDLVRIEEFLASIVQVFGSQMLRYKGILNLADTPMRAIFQGVHQMMGADLGAPWRPGELRETKMVFIGRKLPQAMIVAGLDRCVAQAGPQPDHPHAPAQQAAV